MTGKTFTDWLSGASFGAVALLLVTSPWLFGAWEAWWFWPFVALVFLSSFAFSIRLLIAIAIRHQQPESEGAEAETPDPIRQRVVPLCVAFLIYALARAVTTEVVMDAERNVSLFLTSFLLALQIIFGFSLRQRRILSVLLLINFLLLGLYGIVNHLLFKSDRVLWLPGYEQYRLGGRATGSYFCPNHFAGIMELALAMALGFILNRSSPRFMKALAGCAIPIALFAVVLSKSCGGGLTVILIALVALAWGFGQWPPAVRWVWRGAAAALLAALLSATVFLAPSYMNRFKGYLGWDQLRRGPFPERLAVLRRQWEASSRGQMIAGAIRAWRSRPFVGIGPGMHQNLWFHFAASEDGDREKGIWPTYVNNEFHSYEVHCDWMQLLEEYGIVGFMVFLVCAAAVFWILLRTIREDAIEWAMNDWKAGNSSVLPSALGGLLAVVAMAFHSLFDFNLQIPATAWIFTTLVALALAATAPETLWETADQQAMDRNA